jgi:hypothetical protein
MDLLYLGLGFGGYKHFFFVFAKIFEKEHASAVSETA